MKQNFTSRGFTLVEMVLYVSLCAFILLALSMFLVSLLETRARSQSIAEVNQQGFQVMHSITQTIRNGRSITTPSIGTSSTTLSIVTGNAFLNPTVFDIASGTMRIREGGGQVVLLTNRRVSVSSLVFENISSTSSSEKNIRISFVISYSNLSGRSEYTYTKTFTSSATLR